MPTPSWPPAPAADSGFEVNVATTDSRPTTIAWGTDNLYAGVIVKSMRSSQMIEEIRIENGTGLTSNQVLLDDGNQVEITIVDDRSISDFPDSGDLITLINPIVPGGTLSSTETFVVINNDYNAARKVEGERVFLCKHYILGIPSQGP